MVDSWGLGQRGPGRMQSKVGSSQQLFPQEGNLSFQVPRWKQKTKGGRKTRRVAFAPSEEEKGRGKKSKGGKIFQKVQRINLTQGKRGMVGGKSGMGGVCVLGGTPSLLE